MCSGYRRGGLALFKGRVTDEGRLAIYIPLATIPALAFGLVLETFDFPDLERNVAVVAWNTILYAILMLIADMLVRRSTRSRTSRSAQRCSSVALRRLR